MKMFQAFLTARTALGSLAAACLMSLALAGSASAVSFSPATSFPVGSWPLSVVSGDFNGDGKPDLASGNTVSSSISILLGNGAGGFGASSSFPAGGQPNTIVSADFNGDGKLDVAGGNTFGNTVSVLLGDGSGGLGPAANFPVPGGAYWITAADFNGDGKTDIATANSYPNGISILLGDGAGGFAIGSYTALVAEPRSIISADFNGDGRADLATSSVSPAAVTVLLGDGSGGFGPASSFSAGASPYSVASGDFNGDGKLDLVASNYNTNSVSIMLGDGAGNFGPPNTSGPVSRPYNIKAADFDGDGKLDIATTNVESDQVSVMLGDGAGGLGPTTSYGVGDRPDSVIAVDLNADGLPDLVTSNRFSANLSVLLNTTVVPRADVKITKTAIPGNARPGDTVTYRLKAENTGTAVANNVLVTDTLPVGVSFVSADSPCLESAGNISCALGPMNPGDERILEVEVTVDEWGSADPTYEHLVDVQRVEVQIDLNAGEQKTVQVSCPSGFFATDGSVRIDHIDQGTGEWTAPQVLESRASSLGTWQGTVRNTATGRAQAKIFAVCVRQTTSPNGHNHPLIVSDPATVSDSVLAGRREATLQCGPGQIAIQPGYVSSAPADLLYSEPEGNGWKFALDVKAPSDVTFSIRCLTRQVALTHGHTHDLGFQHIVKEFTVQPGTVNEAQLTCADGYKGIVADQDLDQGLRSLGNDPRPVTRAFKLYNPTDHALNARLSLLCIAERTGGEHAPPKVITNTAWISTTSPETSTANNMSSASFTAEDTDNFTPVTPQPPVKPAPNNPVAISLGGGDVLYSGDQVLVSVNCSGACSGTAKLLTTGAVKVGGRTVRKGSVIARGAYGLGRAGSKRVRLKLNSRGLKLLKGRKLVNGVLKLSSGKGTVVRIRR